ncbi:hypothetical protein ALSL_0341 [Aerosticca soli]|uniref:Uncharacterized protein n=1 Tax=Aerosticca soli TaxID=2010829 RepID=A0A2Z6E1W3_9GAMM|nr:hypothetical protein ALSL_0341 [Aerosticca soli]
MAAHAAGSGGVDGHHARCRATLLWRGAMALVSNPLDRLLMLRL